MTLRTTLTTALIIGLLAPAAFAQSTAGQNRPGQGVKRPDGISARQRIQQRRIQAGQKRGALTETEQGRLLARQRQIRSLEKRLRGSEGRLDGRERVRLHRQLNQLSRAIRRAGRGRG